MENRELKDFQDEVRQHARELMASKGWRYGQAVFNYIDEAYDVARDVQFDDNIDCFYDDDYVEQFIMHAYVKYIESITERKTFKIEK